MIKQKKNNGVGEKEDEEVRGLTKHKIRRPYTCRDRKGWSGGKKVIPRWTAKTLGDHPRQKEPE